MARPIKKRRLVLTHRLAPGDIVTMTGLVRDIVTTLGNQLEIGVETTAGALWQNNPHITDFKAAGVRPRDLEYFNMQYGNGIRDQKYRPIHFLAYWHEDFKRQTGLDVPLTKPYPDLHLSPEERDVPLVTGRYWVTLSGGKSDYPIKVWHVKKLQQVVTALGGMGLGVVQIGSNDTGHWHPKLEGEHVIDLRSQTSLRDMMRLIHHADGVICGVTCAMHMAAALQRPCVVIGGGREAWWWEAYVRENKGLGPAAAEFTMPHRYLHTIGLLDCCKQHGCWKNKVISISNDKMLCLHPVMHPEQPVPLCMDMITADHVLEAVMKYYEDGSLPPINPTTQLTPAPAVVPPAEAVPEAPLPVPQPPAPPVLFDPFASPAPKPAAQPTPQTAPAANRARAQARVQLPPGVTPDMLLKGGPAKLNTNVRMEGRGHKTGILPPDRPGTPQPVGGALNPAAFDHPDVGGKFTVFILFYGGEEYFDLHRRCLTSLLGTLPPERRDLRVGSNALNRRSLEMLRGFCDQGVIRKHYQHADNAYKYPVMREMFYDPSCPIETKWLLWFDDDSICDRTPVWANVLADHIIQYHRRNNAHMFGAPFINTPGSGMRAWCESRPWHKGRDWRLHNGKPSPSGNKIHFCTGAFWALTTEAMRAADIPDPDIGHNGGDITIGEQLYQAGYNFKAWNAKKQFVNMSSVPRRGVTLPMPGAPGHAPKVRAL